MENVRQTTKKLTERKRRCIIEFWGEPKNLIKRSRITVKINDHDVPIWRIPKKLIPLFNETAVYIFYRKDWLIGGTLSKKRNDVAFLYVAPWEFERDYFTGKLVYPDSMTIAKNTIEIYKKR